jgi:hypothetical protein
MTGGTDCGRLQPGVKTHEIQTDELPPDDNHCAVRSGARPLRCPSVPPSFIPVCPFSAKRLQRGRAGFISQWDGYRCIIVKDGLRVRLFSKDGTDWTDRLSPLAEAFAELPTRSAVLDGELCLCDDRGRPDFRAFHAEMRASPGPTCREWHSSSSV